MEGGPTAGPTVRCLEQHARKRLLRRSGTEFGVSAHVRSGRRGSSLRGLSARLHSHPNCLPSSSVPNGLHSSSWAASQNSSRPASKLTFPKTPFRPSYTFGYTRPADETRGITDIAPSAAVFAAIGALHRRVALTPHRMHANQSMRGPPGSTKLRPLAYRRKGWMDGVFGH